jgi:hypothetical protein
MGRGSYVKLWASYICSVLRDEGISQDRVVTHVLFEQRDHTVLVLRIAKNDQSACSLFNDPVISGVNMLVQQVNGRHVVYVNESFNGDGYVHVYLHDLEEAGVTPSNCLQRLRTGGLSRG